MRYFGVILQFFAVLINFYLFTYSTISHEGIYSVLRNSGCKTLGLDSDIFAPRGPGFNPWAVHGVLLAEKGHTDEPSRAQQLCSEQSFRKRCVSSSEGHKSGPFSARVSRVSPTATSTLLTENVLIFGDEVPLSYRASDIP
jgi:hypothetical protein